MIGSISEVRSAMAMKVWRNDTRYQEPGTATASFLPVASSIVVHLRVVLSSRASFPGHEIR
jgi:hypothetical protein